MFRRFDIHIRDAEVPAYRNRHRGCKTDTLGLMTAASGPNSAGVNLSDRELGELRSRIRFKVG